MKVLLVSKASTGGGAAIAAYRLLQDLRKQGMDARMLVQEVGNEKEGIYSSTHGTVKRWMNFIRFVLERLVFLPREKSTSVRFHFSLANTGEDLTKNPYFLDADIIHLHWINAGFLSIRTIQRILRSGKPVVWSFHDEWVFTGGCHLALECRAFTRQCGMCPYLRRPGKKDLSSRLWFKKKNVFSENDFIALTPSKWLYERARSSSLLENFTIEHIPNVLDTTAFKSASRSEASKRLGLKPESRYILFGAASMQSTFKGFEYFREAINIVSRELGEDAGIELLLFGKSAGDSSTLFPMRTKIAGRIKNTADMVDLYSVADVYVNPSLQESFGYTILESMLCGTPVVAFRTAAVSELIEHKKDGYLADYKSVEDLAKGIMWVLSSANMERISAGTRSSVLEKFPEGASAAAHIALYKSIFSEQQL